MKYPYQRPHTLRDIPYGYGTRAVVPIKVPVTRPTDGTHITEWTETQAQGEVIRRTGRGTRDVLGHYLVHVGDGHVVLTHESEMIVAEGVIS